jgi:hypothetical protein
MNDNGQLPPRGSSEPTKSKTAEIGMILGKILLCEGGGGGENNILEYQYY